MPAIFSPDDKKRIRKPLFKEGRNMMLKRGITKTNIDELAEITEIAKGTLWARRR